MSLQEITLFGVTDKVQKAIDRLRAFEPPDGYYLAFSGGKDSQTIYHLAKEAGVQFESHFHMTSVDPPEVISFVREHYPDVIMDKPPESMWRLIERKKIPPTRKIRYCCGVYKEDNTQGVGYNIKKVFDISQVDTRNMKSPAPTPKYTERQLLQALISKAPVKITGVDNLPGELGAMTNPETSEISVRRGMEFAETFKSVAWELSLAEIERSDNIPADANFSAYSAAYMLCKKYGVDTREFVFADATAVFEGMDAQAVKGELSQIRDVACNISGRMAKQLDAVSKAAKSQDAR